MKETHKIPSKAFWKKTPRSLSISLFLDEVRKANSCQTGRLYTSKSESEQKFLGFSERLMLSLESIHLGFYLKTGLQLNLLVPKQSNQQSVTAYPSLAFLTAALCARILR